MPVIALIKLWKETLNFNITILLEPQFFDVPNFPEFLGDPKNIRVFLIVKKHSDLLAVRLEEIDVEVEVKLSLENGVKGLGRAGQFGKTSWCLEQ